MSLVFVLLACGGAQSPPPERVVQPVSEPTDHGPVRQIEVRRLGDGEVTLVADATLDALARIRSGAELPAPLVAWNEREEEMVSVAPPDGQRGSFARIVPRGSDAFLAMLRWDAAEHDLLLADPTVVWEGRFERHTFGDRTWAGSVVAPAVLVANAGEAELSFSGPPGGPLGAVIRPYRDVSADTGLPGYVASLHGDDPGFAFGSRAVGEVGLSKLNGHTFITGEGFARTDHVVLLLPALDLRSASKEPVENGVSLEVYRGGKGDSVDLRGLVEDPALAPLLASFVVDPDPG
ncbi:MAG: hypothetical protein KC656_21035 [Myxococcales bacterium]|nr:hypothetical protein [Myxococcales bacterium]